MNNAYFRIATKQSEVFDDNLRHTSTPLSFQRRDIFLIFNAVVWCVMRLYLAIQLCVVTGKDNTSVTYLRLCCSINIYQVQASP